MGSKRLYTALCVLLCVANAWAEPFEGTFIKITSVDDLTTGYYVVVASESAALPDRAMNSTINSGHVNSETVSISNGTTITDPDNKIVWLITKKGNYYTFRTMAVQSEAFYLYQIQTSSAKGMSLQSGIAGDFTCAGYNSESPIGFKFTLNGASSNKFAFNADLGSLYFANYSLTYTTSITPVRLFKLIEPCSPLDAPTLDGEIAAGTTSATIAWNEVSNADSYEVKIFESSALFAADTVNTLSYTNDTLTANTAYTFSVMAMGDGTTYCDEDNTLLEGSFSTEKGSATKCENIEIVPSASKCLRDGQLILLRGGNTFNAQGQLLR